VRRVEFLVKMFGIRVRGVRVTGDIVIIDVDSEFKNGLFGENHLLQALVNGLLQHYAK
jgi:hypothetical protein